MRAFAVYTACTFVVFATAIALNLPAGAAGVALLLAVLAVGAAMAGRA